MEPEPLPLAPEALLEQQEWVRRVARALVLDEHRAEDLAQQVWVKALEAPPRVRVSLRAWLGTVMRNAARDLGRGNARRRTREEAAARPEALPPTETVVARAETLHRVSAAAIALREPYRTVILLRYFEDLSPPEIARRLDIPLETVRTRLRRGLEALREDLDGESGDRRAWVVALLPFALPWAGPLPPGVHSPAESGAWSGGDAAARAALGTVKEIAAMTARTAVATGLALLVSVGAALWFLRDMEPAAPTVPDMAAAGGRRGRAKPPAPPDRVLGTLPYIADTGGGRPTPPDTGPGGTPAPPSAGPPLAPGTRMPPFAFTLDEKLTLELAVKEGQVLDAWGRPLEAATVEGRPLLTVRGLVVDAETGAGLGATPVQAYSTGGEKLDISGVTDAAGNFEVRGAFKGGWSISAGHRDSTSDYGQAMVKGKGKPDGDLRVELRRGLAIEGRIENADGKPFTGDATVLSWTLDAKGKAIPATQHWVFTADGSFRLRGLDPGPHLVHASAHGQPNGTGEPGVTGAAEPVEAGTKGIVIRLPRAAPIEGRIVDEDGNPVAVPGKVRILPSGQAAVLLRQFHDAAVPGDATFRSKALDPGQSYDIEASGFEGFQTLKKTGVAGGTAGVVLVLVREE